MIEDGRAILGAEIRPLAVARRRVVDAEEHVEHFAVADRGRVEGDLYDLCVSGGAGAYLLVGRVDRRAARVARFDLGHTAELLEHGFQAPEAAAAEGGQFLFR